LQSFELLMQISLRVDGFWDATSCRPNVVEDYVSGWTDIVVYVPVYTILHSIGR
jgi:hypothetical protein